MILNKKSILSILCAIALSLNPQANASQASWTQNLGIMVKDASQAALEAAQNNPKTAVALVVAMAATVAGYKLHSMYKRITTHGPLGWNLDKKEIKTLSFPHGFLWGAGSSAHQVEGNCNNNWTQWEREQIQKKNSSVTELSGIACDHWNRYKEDIQLLKELGVNAFRFSIEWSKVQPEEQSFDESALKHYEDVCDELIKNGIKPCVTLHHYTDPLWFAHKDGFANPKNIPYFVRFCAKVFERLHAKVHLWFTFNSPDGYAAKGYLTGITPPGEKNMQRMGEVYKNLLEAHVQTYHTLKAMDGGSQAQIGILKNIYQLDPARSWNPLDIIGCTIGRSLQDDCFFDFFTTGNFSINVPFKANVKHTNKRAIGAMDFIGINYYSHGQLNNFKRESSKSETPTQSMYTIYPEGLYRAITQIHYELIAKMPKKVPMYITENGIATDDANTRTTFTKQYLYALSKAIQDGYDVRGYIRWALFDNYEWGTYDKHFGEYSVDRTTQKRTLKDGSKLFQSILKQYAELDKKRNNEAFDSSRMVAIAV